MRRIWILLYSILDPIKITLVGSAKVNDMFIALTFPFFFSVDDIKRYAYYKRILFCLFGLLIFETITDLAVIHSESEAFLKGFAAILVSIMSFVFFFKVFKNEKIIGFFIFFSIVRTILSPSDDRLDTDMSYFKFYIAPILSNVVLYTSYLMYKNGKVKFIVGLFCGYSVFCMASDSRSIGLIFILSAILLYIFSKRIKLTPPKMIFLFLISILSFQTLYLVYANSVLNGQLGGAHSVEQIKKLDNPYNPLELLLAGRGEIYGASSAIEDNPVFGHGSWAIDKGLHYTLIEAESNKDDDAVDRLNASDNEHLIPSHSVFTGAWVNYGIGGILCVVLLFTYLVKLGWYLIKNGAPLSTYPILIVTNVQVIWTFFFSPFQHLRYDIPYMGSILLASYYMLIKENSKPKLDMADPDALQYQSMLPASVSLQKHIH